MPAVACVCAAFVYMAAAQEAVGPPPAIASTQPAAVRAATSRPSTRPAPAAATRPAAPFSLSFENVPINAVLEQLSESAGFVVVKEGVVEGRVTLISRQPVTADEAVTLLNTVLANAGYTAIRNGRVLKVMARDAAEKSNVPVHFGADPDDVATSDELITQVIPVHNVDAVKLRQDLTPLIDSAADVTANGGSNAIVVTDRSVNVRRVVQIVSALDKFESSNAELRRYVLKHADAAATVKLVTAIFKPADPQQGRPPQEGEKRREGSDQPLRGRVNAVADDRTNTLFVTAGAETLKVIDGIVSDLESNPSAASEMKVFTLKFADAASAARLLTAVFRPEDLQRRPDEPPRREALEAALRARVTSAADERTNTLVVTAPANTLRVIEQLLEKLDADPASVSEIRVFPLTYADATSAAKLITSIFKPEDAQRDPNQPRRRDGSDLAVNARVNAASDERTNSLVVTAPTETLAVVAKLLQSLDANPAASSEVKAVRLSHADASEASYLLTTLFNPTPGTTAQPAPPPAPGAPPVPARGRLTATSDTRTNTVMLMAPAETLAAAEAVLRELDSNPAVEETLFIYRLKNGQAVKMEAVLNVLFGNAQAGYGAMGLGRLGAGYDPRRGQGGRTSSFGRVGDDARNGALAGLAAFGSRRGRQGLGALGQQALGQGLVPGLPPGFPNVGQQNFPPGVSRALTELSGQVFVVADEDTNSLLVTTATKYLDQVKLVIAELDRPVPQVLIKVLVAEVTHDDATDVGVDFSILNRRPSGLGQTVSTNFGNAAATGGLVVSVLESNVNATLRALATAGRLNVLSRPYILASDNQLASITVGQEVPFVTDSRVTESGQQINTIEYQDVGILLNVTPHINHDGLVIMDVIPEISQLTGSTVQVSEGVAAPVIAKRSAESRVGVINGQTIVIGGLMEDRKTQTISKVPILGDIPLVGLAFSRRQTTKTKTELLIFLTPHVAHQPQDLKGMSADETRGTRLTPNAVEPGTFDEQMRGMKRGASPLTRPSTGGPAAPGAAETILEIPIGPLRRHGGPSTLPATQPAPG
jgi:general secretion pathway protein D